MRGPLLVALAIGWVPNLALGAVAEEAPRAAVLVFARGGADPNVGVRIERDLRNMLDDAKRNGKPIPGTFNVERRYDVGHISTGEIGKSRRHFNDAQRWLEKGDPEEAMEQLFRAERFYKKAIPYAADPALLRGIFFYYSIAEEGVGNRKEATERYCAYVAITRNLAGSAGPLEQFEPLADKCGDTSIAGTAELRITSNVDGAHVVIDGRPVGVIGKRAPFVDPFTPAGPHIVELRKAGYARWGTLVNLRNGKREKVKARLDKARNRKDDYDPLAELVFDGEEAFSEAYIADLMFQVAERFGIQLFIAAYLEKAKGAGSVLTIFTYDGEGVERTRFAVKAGVDGHRPALAQYWKARFGYDLDPADALPVSDRWSPTLFKVE